MWSGARLWRKIVTKWGGESGVKGGGSLRTIMPTYGGITDSVTACVAIILTTIPPLSPAVLLKQLRPSQKLPHARLAKLFEALSRLLHGAFALGVAFRVELVGVTHHLLLHRFG